MNCQKNQWLLRGESYKEKYDRNTVIHRYKGRDSTLCYIWHNLSVPFFVVRKFYMDWKRGQGIAGKTGIRKNWQEVESNYREKNWNSLQGMQSKAFWLSIRQFCNWNQVQQMRKHQYIVQEKFKQGKRRCACSKAWNSLKN